MAKEHYRVLARRRRPETFDEVVGQVHIVRTLQNAIQAGRVAHAYLFCGPRGTGKTTTARLLAKALNCEQGPTPNPCGEHCDACRAIRDGRSLDVIEIDGASTGLVDDIRQLREEVAYSASKGKRKVYIIDEVHMLSIGAFNALLKTLEEPPPHVIFVFATTEPTKVPETILSRCQRYNFRRIPTVDILGQLRTIVEEEGLKAEDDALLLVARKADGAMRDGLSLLEQVLAFSEDAVTADAVRDLLGIIPRDLYFRLFEAILNRDGKAALEVVASVMEEGGDVGEFTQGLMEHLRHLLIASVSRTMADEDLPGADKERYVSMAEQLREDDLLHMLQVVSELELTLGRVSEPRFWLELTVMKLVKMASTESLESLLARLDSLQSGARSGAPAPPARPQADAPSQAPAPRPARRKPSPEPPPDDIPPPDSGMPSPEADPEPDLPEASSPAGEGPAARPMSQETQQDPAEEALPSEEQGEATLEAIRNRWDAVVQAVKKQKISVGTFLLEGTPTSLQGNQLVVSFQVPNAFHANQVRRNRETVEGAIKEVFGVSLRVATELEQRGASGQEQGGKQGAESDEHVQMALRIFDGEILNR